MKKTIILMIAGALAVSCNGWLDVRPKSQIPHNLHFSSESGFFDQLTGVYTAMTMPDMYGMEMTFGLAELLGQNYSPNADLGNTWYNVSRYDYADIAVKTKIDAIWSNTYNCIANLNVMLDNIDRVDRGMFTGDNYSLFKGEALGLRAFLHFDMLRLFAPSHAAGADRPGIPYVREYAPGVARQYTVGQTIDLVLEDLHAALTLLENDPLYYSASRYDHRKRRFYFNYWAVKITLARVYLYKNDPTNAQKYADEVVEACRAETNAPLSWVHFTAATAALEAQRDVVYSNEHAFRLDKDDLDEVADSLFHSSARQADVLSPDDNKIDRIFEAGSVGSLGDDYRHVYGIRYDGARRYMAKYWQPEGGLYNNMVPVIRMSEAYYIAAEARKASDPAGAVALLNEVRAARGLSATPLPETLGAAQIQQEIFKEYRKEFLGEGQLFYYYKRLNLAEIEGAGVVAGANVYVLPMPDNEIEYGNRE